MLDKIQIVEPITLKELRQYTGYTQSEFAEIMNIPFTSYRRYEKDAGKISFAKMSEICKTFGVDISLIKY